MAKLSPSQPFKRKKLIKLCFTTLLARLGVVIGNGGECTLLEEGKGAVVTEEQEFVDSILLPIESEIVRLADLLPRLLSTALCLEANRKKCPVLLQSLDVPGMEALVDLIWERLSALASKTITLGQTRSGLEVQETLFSQLGDSRADVDGLAVSRFIDPCCGSGVLLGAHVKRMCAKFESHSSCSSSDILRFLSRLTASTFGVDIDLNSCVLSRFRLICCMVPTLVDSAFARRADL